MSKKFTHIDVKGEARMVDVSGKPVQQRTAVARGEMRMGPATLKLIRGDKIASNYPDFVKQAGENGLIGLDGIAETFMYLHKQPRNAWTHELDLRTFKEDF